jgi:SAM-dependent methyltransferase
MHLDVVELRNFYYATELGRMVQRMVRARLRGMWPDIHGQSLVGFGFAAPFLRPFMEEAARTVCLMPAQQGVCPWPPEGPNLAALIEETLWPLPSGFADRLIVAHGLESSERPAALLDEIWRVLAPGGKAIFLVPNRAGIWARRDATPFGHGRPYSIRQLSHALAQSKFSAERTAAALYLPPSHRRFWLKTAPAIERLGQRIVARRFAGVVMIEAVKLVYIAPHSGASVSSREPLRVLDGLRPKPKPATGSSAARETV